MKTTWSAVVVFECEETRDKAVSFCNRLVDRFWTQMGFEISWWSFDMLRDATLGGEAAAKAAKSRLIIFATTAEGEMPFHVFEWVEKWVGQRSDQEGALVGLADRETSLTGVASAKHVYLREIAHRAGMDYLTKVPDNLSACPDSPESCAERAHTQTTLLEEILNRPTPAPPSLLVLPPDPPRP